MAPLSGWPALPIGPLSKNCTICISRFFGGGGQGCREIIFRVWAVASESRKKQCAMPSIAASFVAAKKRFSRRFATFAWSRRHTFSYLRNFDRSWSSRRCCWRRLHAVWAISGSCHQPRSRRRSVSCDRVNVNKPKLRNFDRPLGLPGHLHSPVKFLHQQKKNVTSLRNTTVRVCGNCRCHQPWNNSRDQTDVKAEGTRDICGISMHH